MLGRRALRPSATSTAGERTERCQPGRVDQYQPPQASTPLDGEAGGQGARGRVGDQDRRLLAGRLDQRLQPCSDRPGVQAGGRRRLTQPGQVGHHHPMGPHKVREDPPPDDATGLDPAVQQHQGRAVSALQHRGGDAVKLSMLLFEQQPLQQLLPAGLVWVLHGHGVPPVRVRSAHPWDGPPTPVVAGSASCDRTSSLGRVNRSMSDLPCCSG